MDLSIVLPVPISVCRRKPHVTVRAPVGLGSPFPGEWERSCGSVEDPAALQGRGFLKSARQVNGRSFAVAFARVGRRIR